MRGLFHTAGKDSRAPHLPAMQRQYNRMPEVRTLWMDSVPDLPASTELRTANTTQNTQFHGPAISSRLPQTDHNNSITAT